MPSFPERLKELRISKNLTQVKMSELLGFSEQHYQKLEYGKVTPNAILLEKLADYFDVSTDYLLGRTNRKGNGKLS